MRASTLYFRHILQAVTFFLLILLLPALSFSAEIFATVLKISDGDTIWVKTEGGRKIKLRLLGIDTPEKFPGRKLERDALKCRVREGKIKNLGQLATHHAKRLLHRGDVVRVIIRGRGYYRRALAIVFLPDGTNFNLKMVEDGFACVYTWHGKRPEHVGILEYLRLKKALLTAKKERRGLWKVAPELMRCLCGQ